MKLNELGIKENIEIYSKDDDWVCKTNSAKSFEYGNNNINLKVKN